MHARAAVASDRREEREPDTERVQELPARSRQIGPNTIELSPRHLASVVAGHAPIGCQTVLNSISAVIS
jgi:hypothetical protein